MCSTPSWGRRGAPVAHIFCRCRPASTPTHRWTAAARRCCWPPPLAAAAARVARRWRGAPAQTAGAPAPRRRRRTGSLGPPGPAWLCERRARGEQQAVASVRAATGGVAAAAGGSVVVISGALLRPHPRLACLNALINCAGGGWSSIERWGAGERCSPEDGLGVEEKVQRDWQRDLGRLGRCRNDSACRKTLPTAAQAACLSRPSLGSIWAFSNGKEIHAPARAWDRQR